MQSQTKKVYYKDFFLALLGYILFVCFDSLNKNLTGTYHVSQIIFVNSLGALIPIFLFTRFKNGWEKLKKANLKVHFTRAGFMFISMTCFMTSLAHLPLVIMYSVAFSAPLILTVGANLFLREKVGWRRYTAIFVGFIGVLVSLDPFNEPLNKYIFLAFVPPFTVSISWLITRKYGQKESIYSFLIYGKFYMLIFSGIFLFNHFISMNLNDLFVNICSGILRGSALIFIFKSAQSLPSSLFAPTQYIQMFAAAIIGYLVFNDVPTLNNYLGNFLIIGAGIFIIIRELKLSKTIVTKAARPATIPTEAKE